MEDLENEFMRSPEMLAALFWFVYIPIYIIVKIIIVIGKWLLKIYFSFVSKHEDNSYSVLGESKNYREPPSKNNFSF